MLEAKDVAKSKTQDQENGQQLIATAREAIMSKLETYMDNIFISVDWKFLEHKEQIKQIDWLSMLIQLEWVLTPLHILKQVIQSKVISSKLLGVLN